LYGEAKSGDGFQELAHDVGDIFGGFDACPIIQS
jgi:hypothetical protein